MGYRSDSIALSRSGLLRTFWERDRVHWGRTKGAAKGSWRNGCPKGCFWRVRFLSAPLRFSGSFSCFKRNLKGAEKKRTLQKHPFGQPFLRTTPSPLLWRALISWKPAQGPCLCVQGALSCPTRRAFLCTLYMETPNGPSKNLLKTTEGS